MSRLHVLPLLVVIALYGVVGPSPMLAVLMAVVAGASLVFGGRLAMSSLAQLLLSALLMVFGSLVIDAAFAAPPQSLIQLRAGWGTFAGTTLLITLPRLYLARPLGDHRASLGLALVALTACGGTYSADIYVPSVLAFTVSALLARRYADEGRTPLRQLDAHWLLPAGVLLVVASGVAWSISGALPVMHGWAIERISQYTVPRAGFSDRMWLGTMRGLLLSERKVLRVRGGKADHLRGIVYDRYEGGRWINDAGERMRTITAPTELSGGGEGVTLEILERDPERYFLPLEATQVAVSSGVARLGRSSILAPIAAEPATHVRYHTTGERAHPIAPAAEGDLQLPADIRRPLAQLAAGWTQGARDTSAALDAIEGQLMTGYAYSLEFEHSGRNDPVLEFLLRRKSGHCEYFATAMALLARSQGIPARVVGGYRVTERNELGDYYIVRERNAHTWVEAWVPGQGWQTYDPTPPADLMAYSRTRSGLLAGLADIASGGWTGFLRWLDRRSWLEMITAPTLFLALLLAVRWLRRWRRRGDDEEAGEVDPPLPCFEHLHDALAARGVVRSAGETLEQLAARLSEADLPGQQRADAARLLRRYAALRYGDRGDLSELERDIGNWCEQLAASHAVAKRALG